MGDYHVHLHPHVPRPDSPPPGVYPKAHVDAYVEAALSRGADEVGFTEHLHRFVDFEPALAGFWDTGDHRDLVEHSRRYYYHDLNLHLDRYVEAVQGARDRGLPVLLGLEVDFFPAHVDKVVEVLLGYPFDYLIGSVHWIGAWSVDHPDVAYEFARRGVRRSYAGPLRARRRLAESGLVQVLAHPDVVKKFGHRCDDEPIDLYRRVVDAARRGGAAWRVQRRPALRGGRTVPGPSPVADGLRGGRADHAGQRRALPRAGCSAARIASVRYARSAGYRHRLKFGVGGAATLVALP